ncbi:MAG: tail tape measure protein [Sphingomonadaceae bacterium]
MDNEMEELLVEVRAVTAGFDADMVRMRSSVDHNLADGFARAGTVLERGLLSAIERGSLGFDDLKRIAFSAIDQIAMQALRAGIGSLGGAGPDNGIVGTLGTLIGTALGLPGRASGGPVSPGRGYLVGERGPEVFVPTSAGRVEAGPGTASGRQVNVSIALAAPRGTAAPVALQRSGRQIASAIRQSLREF